MLGKCISKQTYCDANEQTTTTITKDSKIERILNNNNNIYINITTEGLNEKEKENFFGYDVHFFYNNHV